MSFVSNSTGAFYERSLSQLGQLRSSLVRFQNQIATGQRLERNADDPVAASRLRGLARIERLSEVQADNADKLARDLDEAGDEVLGMANLLSRARELAIQASNDPTGEGGRAAIAEELEQLEQELFNRANAQTLSGEALFAGTSPGPAFIRAGDGSVSYNGTSDVAPVSVAPGQDIDRGLPGNRILEFDVGGTPTNAFAIISDLSAALRPGSVDPGGAALAAIEGFDVAIETTTRSQTVLGTRLAWVEMIQENQADRAVSVAEEKSELGDTDIAEAIARLQQTLTALEASQQTFTRVAGLTLFNAI